MWYPVAAILPLLWTFVRAQVHAKAVYTKTRRGDKKHFASPPWCHKLLADLSSRMGVGGRWMKGGMEGGWEKKVRVRFIILGGRSEGPRTGRESSTSHRHICCSPIDTDHSSRNTQPAGVRSTPPFPFIRAQ